MGTPPLTVSSIHPSLSPLQETPKLLYSPSVLIICGELLIVKSKVDKLSQPSTVWNKCVAVLFDEVYVTPSTHV